MEMGNGTFTPPPPPPPPNRNIIDAAGNHAGDGQTQVLDIHPLSNYYFGSKPALPFRNETFSDRLLRIKSNYNSYGLRTNVEAVMLVELFKHPHLLLLQVRNCTYKLPGGRLRPGESDIDGLKRKLSRKLSVDEDDCGSEWEVGECLGMWWRPDFESTSYPYLSSSVRSPKVGCFLTYKDFLGPNGVENRCGLKHETSSLGVLAGIYLVALDVT